VKTFGEKKLDMQAQSLHEANQIQARSSVEVIEQFRMLSNMPATLSIHAYMRQVASRFERASGGLTLRVDTPDHFVSDLIRYGWLRVA